MVAVPATPPQNRRHIPRLENICLDSQAVIALSNAEEPEWRQSRSDVPTLQSLHWINSVTDKDYSKNWHRPDLYSDALAFLQYTSGATAAPKGVMISHENVLNNLKVICTAFRLTRDDVGVFWLPVFHDMGLIGGILSNIYIGGQTGSKPKGCTYLMPPSAFVESPIRWLKALTRYHATITGAPNFAFNYCLERITDEQRASLDLGTLKTVFCGAEPVHYETLARFAVAFASSGFRRDAFQPVYGLAENTLMVTHCIQLSPLITCSVRRDKLMERRIELIESTSPESQTFVSCGRSSSTQRLIIVDPDTRLPTPSDQVGEIWVTGPSVAAGYWNKAQATRDIFGASLEDAEKGLFLRTGDLGFLMDEELYIVGRLKDLIIIRGKNYYPEDLETIAEASHPAIQGNATAAFSIDLRKEERLVIALELQRAQRHANFEEVADFVRASIVDANGLETYAVVVLPPAGLPRTTSGKIQRSLCKEKFLAKTLEPIGVSLRSEPKPMDHEKLKRQALLEADLRVLLAQMLEIPLEQVDLNLPLHKLGLGSLHAVAIKYHLEEQYGILLPADIFASDQTLAQIVAKLVD